MFGHPGRRFVFIDDLHRCHHGHRLVATALSGRRRSICEALDLEPPNERLLGRVGQHIGIPVAALRPSAAPPVTDLVAEDRPESTEDEGSEEKKDGLEESHGSLEKVVIEPTEDF